MSEEIKVAFASGSDDILTEFIERIARIRPDLPLYVVSEFPCAERRWIPYHVVRSFCENYARCRAAFRGKRVRFSAAIFQPRMPYWRMRLIAFLISPIGFVAFNENLDNFMLRPRCAGAIVRHLLWRLRNFVVWEFTSQGSAHAFLSRLRHPRAFRRPAMYFAAVVAGWIAALLKTLLPAQASAASSESLPEGITVVIPSRNGRELLARLLPGVLRDLEGTPSEVIVVDNGSGDGTLECLRQTYPQIAVEHSLEPLSFARAVNRGIRRARYSWVCLLNNDMVIDPGFFLALCRAFDHVPDLFCATAQIFFPPGARREETGKAVMVPPPARQPGDFPIRCELPLPGEDLSYVLYGSGGCSLYSTGKLRQIGGVKETYAPAYVEDLDLGYRAWLRGWPTVFVAGARVTHVHRATTSRYFSPAELQLALETNYLRFVASAPAAARAFRNLWSDAIRRLNALAEQQDPASLDALSTAWRAPLWIERPPANPAPEEIFLALTGGDTAVFPGRNSRALPVVLVASPYLPFPLSHGGAVRMYNLMRRAAAGYDQVLVSFAEKLDTPPQELLDICSEIVIVRRTGSHSRPSTARPDVVEEFDSTAFRGALQQTVRKWRPFAVQLEFTQMAQYAPDCAPAPAILVEHDITFDLHEQLLALEEDWDLQRQLGKWRRFETEAWRRVSCVVTMSEKDRRIVAGARAVPVPNGVDLNRFAPSDCEPEQARLLFIGSFAHLPNVLAVDFFLREVWPLLGEVAPALHIIAGANHRYYFDRYRRRARVNLDQPGIELEDFVADVRPAYRRAAVVVAPLVASAGTNIKILEAMAMGKAIVSTPAGINGLDLTPGRDLIVAETPGEMAAAIAGLLRNPEKRKHIEQQARAAVEQHFGWDAIARRQRELYAELIQSQRHRDP